jgi:hypothetical protein
MQQCAAACLHATSIVVWIHTWQTTGSMATRFIALNYAALFYGGWCLGYFLRAADGLPATSWKGLQRVCISYVDSGTAITHWNFILLFHVWHNSYDQVAACPLGSTGACTSPSDSCISAMPLLHALLSSLIVCLLGGRSWIAAPNIVAMNMPWLLRFVTCFRANLRRHSSVEFTYVTLISMCMIAVMSIYSWRNMLTRSEWLTM